MSNERKLVRVVVGCANRKLRPPAQGLRLGAYPTGIEARSAQWLKRIATPETDTMAAHDLYMGEHWSVVKGLHEAAGQGGCDIEIWVASAGYGLVPAESLLEPYSATFSPGSDDSVVQGVLGEQRSEANRYWWEQLTKPRAARETNTRSLTQLAQKDPSVSIVVALSKTYVQAVREDLNAASLAMGNNNNLMLVTTGGPLTHLEHIQLPCDARFVNSLGGTRTALNVRVADLIVRNCQYHSFNLTKVRSFLAHSLDNSGSLPTYGHRERKSDAVIRGLIRDRLRDHDYSRSSLLRLLRDEGFACEQRRFSTLFDEVSDKGRQ